MRIGNFGLSIIVAGIVFGLFLTYSLLVSSGRSSVAWQPAAPDPKTLISAVSVVEEAHTWYASSKQESDPIQALIRTSYGIACLRTIQNSIKLTEVEGASLPATVNGPEGLMSKLLNQQHVLISLIQTPAKTSV